MLIRILIMLLVTFVCNPALAGTKVALLIGNAEYSGTMSRLKNPLSDVQLLRETLIKAEFKVFIVENASLDGMSSALDSFEETAKGADIGLIYYSGHGIEVGGENYLVPIDAKLSSDRKIKYEAIAMMDVLASLNGVAKLKLVLLDACRDNPALSNMKKLVTRGSGSKGLAKVEASESDMLIGYATAPGDTAQDGEGNNSPYAAALSRHLVTPGAEIESALRAVAKDVYTATGGKQRPYKTGSLLDDVRLGLDAQSSVSVAPAVEQEALRERPEDLCKDAGTHWESIQKAGDKRLFEEHLHNFANCAFASLAKRELQQMSSATSVSQPTEVAKPLFRVVQVGAFGLQSSSKNFEKSFYKQHPNWRGKKLQLAFKETPGVISFDFAVLAKVKSEREHELVCTLMQSSTMPYARSCLTALKAYWNE